MLFSFLFYLYFSYYPISDVIYFLGSVWYLSSLLKAYLCECLHRDQSCAIGVDIPVIPLNSGLWLESLEYSLRVDFFQDGTELENIL